MKATEMEGEKRGRIELGIEEEAGGFDGDTGTGDEHEGEIVTKGSQISFKIFCLFSSITILFYRDRKRS